MENIELQNIWKSYDQKMERVLNLNQEIAINLSRQKLNRQLRKLYFPKWSAVLIGVPYTLLLIAVTTIAVVSKAYIVAMGFGMIALIMTSLLIKYGHQLYLINQIRNDDEVLSTQKQLSKLKISSFNSIRLAIFQLPFWSVCWVSLDALKENPMIYGGVNLFIFVFLSYLAYWLFQQVNYTNKPSWIRDLFLSGKEWEPILRSSEILKQIQEYENDRPRPFIG